MKEIKSFLWFLFGGMAGAASMLILMFIGTLDERISEGEQPINGSWQIDGYEKPDQYQKEDIGMLMGTYRVGSMRGGLFEKEMFAKDIEELDKWDEKMLAEDKIIDIKEFKNTSFSGNVYQAVEISTCGQERYENLEVYPKNIERLGRKKTIEIRFESEESDKDYFIIVISANGDTFFVPPLDMRTGENGEVYWIAYSLYLNKDATEETS